MTGIFKSLKNFLKIFEKENKSKYYFFIFSNLFITILEMLSLSILFPLLNLIINPSFALEINKYISGYIGNLSFNQIIISILFILLIIFITKNILIAILSYAQIKYSLNLQNKLATSLLKKYINTDYLFFKENDSSKFIRIINNDSTYVITGFIMQSFVLFTELSIFLGIIILLIYYEIKGLLVIILFFLISSIIYKTFSKKLKYHGKLKQSYDTLRIKFITDIFEGIKEILFYKKQLFFFNLYEEANLKSNSSQAFLEGVKIIPRLLLETFSILAFCLVIIILIFSGKELIQFIPLFGIYIVAAFKILPSLNRIISSIQQMRFNKTYLDTVISEYQYGLANEKSSVKRQVKSKKLNFNSKIELKNICFNYKSNNLKKNILNNFNLSFEKNLITAIVGRSGSGKSTIIDILLGLVEQDSGEIFVDGKNVDLSNSKLKIGYVPQSKFLLNDTIKHNIALGIDSEKIDLKKINKAIELSSLEYDFKYSKLSLDSIVGQKGLQISGGQAQRIIIARALYDDPDIIIFDEATSSLDKNTENEIVENMLVLKKNKSILLVTHSDRILKYCDKIISLDKDFNAK